MRLAILAMVARLHPVTLWIACSLYRDPPVSERQSWITWFARNGSMVSGDGC